MIDFKKYTKQQLIMILSSVERKCDFLDELAKEELDYPSKSMPDYSLGRESGFRQSSKFVRQVLMNKA